MTLTISILNTRLANKVLRILNFICLYLNRFASTGYKGINNDANQCKPQTLTQNTFMPYYDWCSQWKNAYIAKENNGNTICFINEGHNGSGRCCIRLGLKTIGLQRNNYLFTQMDLKTHGPIYPACERIKMIFYFSIILAIGFYLKIIDIITEAIQDYRNKDD